MAQQLVQGTIPDSVWFVQYPDGYLGPFRSEDGAAKAHRAHERFKGVPQSMGTIRKAELK